MFSFLAILVLGFLLGMRHATDPDHVVAVTTIVTKQPGIAKAGLIGVLWGLGHTFTIFVVGTMIILFQVTIPPRVGLSKEFTVAAMLILLGLLNLTGKLRWLQQKFTPTRRSRLQSAFPAIPARRVATRGHQPNERPAPEFRMYRTLQGPVSTMRCGHWSLGSSTVSRVPPPWRSWL